MSTNQNNWQVTLPAQVKATVKAEAAKRDITCYELLGSIIYEWIEKLSTE
jgi:hypothetical protein